MIKIKNECQIAINSEEFAGVYRDEERLSYTVFEIRLIVLSAIS